MLENREKYQSQLARGQGDVFKVSVLFNKEYEIQLALC